MVPPVYVGTWRPMMTLQPPRIGRALDERHSGLLRLVQDFDRAPLAQALRPYVAALGRDLARQGTGPEAIQQGIRPSGAARLLVEVGDITRFPGWAHFASWNGTAHIDAPPGDQVRHRLSRAGNRQINRVLYIMATVQLRNPTQGRAYFDRKTASGKISMEAMPALKRRLSDIVYRRMLDGACMQTKTGLGRHRGATTDSSAAGSHPHAVTSDKPLPGPATAQPTTTLSTAS
jgi:hypothetical protein